MKKLLKLVKQIVKLVYTIIRYPVDAISSILMTPEFCRGMAFSKQWPTVESSTKSVKPTENPLWNYFSKNNEGPGIWKWTHYFDVYQRHFAKFKNSSVNIAEIGIYSGGSLPMWLNYFGEDCHVFGVDIEEACKAYESDRIKIIIGDQEDRNFWKKFRESTPDMHILIDDGGHTPEQQMVTLEETLPYMPLGSVYMCEDIHGIPNRFIAFATAFVHKLNALKFEGSESTTASNIQQAFHSIHFYPYLLVIEKHEYPPEKLISAKRGTEWQPFFNSVTE